MSASKTKKKLAAAALTGLLAMGGLTACNTTSTPSHTHCSTSTTHHTHQNGCSANGCTQNSCHTNNCRANGCDAAHGCQTKAAGCNNKNSCNSCNSCKANSCSK